ncbi:MAG: MarR family transcriptional regulator [Parvibaculaceae bacterium]|nr:MarR family transcriptional regulator [Parvibaculaceae bacterium]
MTDIKLAEKQVFVQNSALRDAAKTALMEAVASKMAAPNKKEAQHDPLNEVIELLFFAYRDFTSDPDAILADYDFGRAHHRVIHFVGRHPGITVAQLLAILGITKQSLARVLKQLVEEEYVIQKTGTRDRRQRLLHLSNKGEQLERRLSEPQRKRVSKALNQAGPEAIDTFRKTLLALINQEDQATVEKLTGKGSTKGETS